MDKKLAKLIQDECEIALIEIAVKHGLTVRQHGGTLGDISMILKFEFKTADTAAVIAAEKAEFVRYAHMFGLEPSDYGAMFVANGKNYTVIGLDLKRRKFPIRVKSMDTGAVQLFTDMVVDRIKLARAKVAS